jgi:hypothetical protein
MIGRQLLVHHIENLQKSPGGTVSDRYTRTMSLSACLLHVNIKVELVLSFRLDLRQNCREI